MHYVYHPNHPAKIVTPEEYHSYLSHGWYDTPAKFPKEMQKVRKEKKDKVPHETSDSDSKSQDQEVTEKKKRGRPPNDNRS